MEISSAVFFVTVWIKLWSLINGSGRKGFTLLGCESSCANIIAQQYTRFTKTAARHPARKKKNLWRQWPVIFTQGDSWMAHTQLWRAPHTSGQRPVVLVAPDAEQMRLFGNFLVAIEDWNTMRSVALSSVKIFKQRYEKSVFLCACGCFAGICLHGYKSLWSTQSFGVQQPPWGQTLWEEGVVSLCHVNTLKRTSVY